jgi:hypothetical protein
MSINNTKSCEGIVISANAEYGNDPVPLFEAGKGKITCVLELEAMATIQLSKATFESRIPDGGEGCFSYFGLTLKNCAIKHSITAQSGDAYFVSTLVATGQKG